MTKTEHGMKAWANKFAICLFLLLVAGFYSPRQAMAALPDEQEVLLTATDDDEKLVTLNITQRTLMYILSEIPIESRW